MPRPTTTRRGLAAVKRSRLVKPPAAYLLPAAEKWDPAKKLRVTTAENPIPLGTLGAIDVGAKVTGSQEFPLTLLIQPFNPRAPTGVDLRTLRMFRWENAARALRPVWNSGVNVQLGFAWAKITRPGTFVPIGLPLDPIAREIVSLMARFRAYADTPTPQVQQEIMRVVTELLSAVPEEELATLRRDLAQMELRRRKGQIHPAHLVYGHGGHILGFLLPHNLTTRQFKEHLETLKVPPSGLPEEALFQPPELQHSWDLWSPHEDDSEPEPGPLPALPLLGHSAFSLHWSWFRRRSRRNWWMYHHDERHSGHASSSGITSTNVGTMTLAQSTPLPSGGNIVTIPSIVRGKIYVGTTDDTVGGTGGTLYKIDLATGVIDQSFPVPQRMPAYSQGIGGSPAIVEGRIYFSALPGWVYCLDATTFGLLWVTDLRNADPPHRQPVQNPQADCWTSPVVVKDRVYVGCGEGESGAFGFVYCLDADTGDVIWLFCTNKFSTAADNSPNVIPNSAVGITPLPTGFSAQPDPPFVGASVWSSCAYDRVLNRIYVGTGNATGAPPPGAIDSLYGSGILSLDASTGAFMGFFQPSPADSYRPTDDDIDVCGSPTLFVDDDVHKVSIGSKSGAYFVLDADTLAVLAIRQLLPYDAITAAPLPGFDPGPGENMWGVFATAGVHYGLERLYIGLGGYNGIGNYQTTPFMRAVYWDTLDDAWAMANQAVGANTVSRYLVPNPPMYTTPDEAALSSPAVVNDVVFVSTTRPGLYALCAHTGLCLWVATGIAGGPYVLGPAVYGDAVVVGSGSSVYVYSL